MKTLIAAALCLFAQDPTAPPSSVTDLGWLVGTWNGPEKVVITSVIGGKFLQIDIDHKDSVDRHMIGFDATRKALTLWFFGGGEAATGTMVLAASSTKDVLVWEGTIATKETSAEIRWTVKRMGADEFLISTEMKAEGAWKVRGSSKYKRTVIDRSTPKAVVDAAVEAMKKPDVDALGALMTPEWAKREREWKKSFTNALLKGYQLISAEIREPEIDGDKATISVKAKFKTPEGEDGEGLRFVLEKKEGSWWISELK